MSEPLSDTLPNEAAPHHKELIRTAMPGLSVKPFDASLGWKLAEGHTTDPAVVEKMFGRAKAQGYLMHVHQTQDGPGAPLRHRITIYQPRGKRMQRPTEFYGQECVATVDEYAAEQEQLIATHMTNDEAAAAIRSSGTFQPSKQGWRGPGLYAHVGQVTQGEGKGDTPVHFDYSHLKMHTGGRPAELSQAKWDRLRRMDPRKIDAALVRLGYDGDVDHGSGWVRVFPQSVHKISPMQPDRYAANDSPEFKSWFAGSKMHRKGKPVTLYHGTSSDRDIDSFEPLSFFAQKPATASAYAGAYGHGHPSPSARVYPVHVNFRSPLMLTPQKVEEFQDYVARLDDEDYERHALEYDAFIRRRPDWGLSPGPDGLRKAAGELLKFPAEQLDYRELDPLLPVMRHWAMENGHDAIARPHDAATHGWRKPEEYEFINFHPHQVKSAVSNSGAWSQDDPRLSYRQDGNPERYAKDTQGFRDWFGESKAVHPTGQPLTLYHGTPHGGFDQFDDKANQQANIYGRGHYMSEDPEIASKYATQTEGLRGKPSVESARPAVYPVHVRVTKPFHMADSKSPITPKDLRSISRAFAEREGIDDPDWLVGNYDKSYRPTTGAVWTDLVTNSKTRQQGAQDALRAAGFDGIRGRDGEWVVFDGHNIKSATSNSGDYSRDDARLTYTQPGRPDAYASTESPEFHQWFGDSKAKAPTGEPLRLYHGTSHDFDAFGGGRAPTELSQIGWHYLSDNPEFAGKFAVSDRPLPVEDSLKPKKVTIATQDGPLEVDGWETHVPGLVLTRNGERISVTHSPSGMAAHLADDLGEAHRVASELGRVRGVKWDAPQIDTRAMSQQKRTEIRNAIERGREDPAIAAMFGYKKAAGLGEGSRMMPVHAAIQNPVDLRAIKGGAKINPPKLISELAKHGINLTIRDLPFAYRNVYQMLNQPDVAAKIREQAMDNGYDGVVFNDYYDPKTKGTTWVAFHPQQIKSASTNTGEYSKSDTRIAYRAAFHQCYQERYAGRHAPSAMRGTGSVDVPTATETQARSAMLREYYAARFARACVDRYGQTDMPGQLYLFPDRSRPAQAQPRRQATQTPSQALAATQAAAAHRKAMEDQLDSPGPQSPPEAERMLPTAAQHEKAQRRHQSIHQTEDRIREYRDHERAVILNDDGSVAHEFRGSRYSATIPPDLVGHLGRKTFLHNHPRGWNEGAGPESSKGSSFSDKDIAVAVAHDLAEMRAVSPGWRHSLRIPPGWQEKAFKEWFDGLSDNSKKIISLQSSDPIHKGRLLWDHVVKPVCEQLEQERRDHYWPQIRALGESPEAYALVDRANGNHHHEVNERLANHFGWHYDREEHKPWTEPAPKSLPTAESVTSAPTGAMGNPAPAGRSRRGSRSKSGSAATTTSSHTQETTGYSSSRNPASRSDLYAGLWSRCFGIERYDQQRSLFSTATPAAPSNAPAVTVPSLATVVPSRAAILPPRLAARHAQLLRQRGRTPDEQTELDALNRRIDDLEDKERTRMNPRTDLYASLWAACFDLEAERYAANLDADLSQGRPVETLQQALGDGARVARDGETLTIALPNGIPIRARLARPGELAQLAQADPADIARSGVAAGQSQPAPVAAYRQGELIFEPGVTRGEIDHEILHGLQQMGLFTPQELALWGGNSEQMATEYQHWIDGGRHPTEHGMFERAHRTLAGIRQTLSPAKQQVFEQVDRGLPGRQEMLLRAAVSHDGTIHGPSVMFATRQWRDWMSKALSDDRVTGKFKRDELEKIKEQMERTAAILGKDNFAYLPDEEGGSPIRKNSDPTFNKTMDASTICPHQDQYVAQVLAVQKRLNRVLSKRERQALGDLMMDRSAKNPDLKPSCWYCYGQTGRDLLPDYLVKFKRVFGNASAAHQSGEYQQLLRASRSKNKATVQAAKSQMDELFGADEPNKWNKSGYDSALSWWNKDKNTPSELAKFIGQYHGNEEIRKVVDNLPRLEELILGRAKPESDAEKIVVKAAKKSKPMIINMPKGWSSYKDQVLKMNDDEIARHNAVAGLRFNSQTDYRPWHGIELAQIMTHMGAKGLKGHVYTRSPEFLDAFAKTGMKFNLSMGYAHDANGLVDRDATGRPVYDMIGITRNQSDHYRNANRYTKDEYFDRMRQHAAANKKTNPRWLDDLAAAHHVSRGKVMKGNNAVPESNDRFIERMWDAKVPDPVPLRQFQQDKNIANMLVAMNDHDIDVGLNDPDVHMMIPFHAGPGIPEDVQQRRGVKNYEGMNHEGWDTFVGDPGKYREVVIKKKLVKIPLKTITLNDGTRMTIAKEQVINREHHRDDKERYMEICEKLGITPRFGARQVIDPVTKKPRTEQILVSHKGKRVDVTEHPEYMKLVRDVAASPGQHDVIDATKIDWDAMQDAARKYIDRGGHQKDVEANPGMTKLLLQDIKDGRMDRIVAGKENVQPMAPADVLATTRPGKPMHTTSGVLAPTRAAADPPVQGKLEPQRHALDLRTAILDRYASFWAPERYRAEGRDVSNEPRDEKGEWTKGAGKGSRPAGGSAKADKPSDSPSEPSDAERPAEHTKSSRKGADEQASNEDLVARFKAGDRKAMDQLLERNEAFIAKFAHPFARQPADLDDLMNIGRQAMWIAATKFDPSMGNTFLTYIGTVLTRRFLKVHLSQGRGFGKKARAKMLQSPEDDEGRPLAEPVAPPEEPPLESQERKAALDEALAGAVKEHKISPRHLLAIRMHFGLQMPKRELRDLPERLRKAAEQWDEDGHPSKTQGEVADVLGLQSKQGASAVILAAQRALKDYLPAELYAAVFGGTPEKYAGRRDVRRDSVRKSHGAWFTSAP